MVAGALWIGSAGFLWAGCGTIDLDFRLDLACVAYEKQPFHLVFDRYVNPDEPNWLYWKFRTLGTAAAAAGCGAIDDGLNLMIPCADYQGIQFELGLTRWTNSREPEGIYWRLASGGIAGPGSSDGYTLLAWNDLGMHCMDGNDYAVFAILPPYNNLHAQAINRDALAGKRVTTGVTLTYEASAQLDGRTNTSSADKTNFWEHAATLFDLAQPLAPDVGLTGNPVQRTTPAPLTYSLAHEWWEAEGIPITPYNDDRTKNFYPLVKVTLKDTAGGTLATTRTVLPVSDEMDCRRCHASASGDDAKPAGGWVNAPDAEKDYKLNILRLHDERMQTFLAESVAGGTPILCASCHRSNALPGTGVSGIRPLTAVVHARHAGVRNPDTGQALDSSNDRSVCYLCHPGSQTECLRGAMGKAQNPDGSSSMSCQSCHGPMSAVGRTGREGWFEEPNCQSCHQNGQRFTTAVIDAAGTLRPAADPRFATNPDTPQAGVSLYRFSVGHGDLQCESCHGATHSVYPSVEAGDNLQSIALQGHAGTIAECTVCHRNVPQTVTGGPHGMHTVGQSWVNAHGDAAEHNPMPCAACHGSDYRGSFLSHVTQDRTFRVEDAGTKFFGAGYAVNCYDCHNGPDGEDD